MKHRLKISPYMAAWLVVALILSTSILSAGGLAVAPVESVQSSGQATAQRSAPAPTVIHLTAEKSRYDPASLHVKAGSTVELHITAVDRSHGFLINAYPDKAATAQSPGLIFPHPQTCLKIEKGQEAVITFEARTPGTYAFRCCVFCGFGHLGMKGELIVDP